MFHDTDSEVCVYDSRPLYARVLHLALRSCRVWRRWQWRTADGAAVNAGHEWCAATLFAKYQRGWRRDRRYGDGLCKCGGHGFGIREFADRIHCAHIKGVQVIREHTRAGLLGGHRPMGHRLNGWNFVTAGTARDANSVEEILIELNRVGFDGAVSIEWEDNDAEQHAGAKTALANVRRADLPPSGMRHDEMLKA